MSMAFDDWTGAGDWDDLMDPEIVAAEESRRRQREAAKRAQARDRKKAARAAAGKRVVDMGFWTEFRVARLKKMWAEGVSGAEIARQLGAASASAVYGKADRIGLPIRLDAGHPQVKHVRRIGFGTPMRPEAGGRSPARAQP